MSPRLFRRLSAILALGLALAAQAASPPTPGPIPPIQVNTGTWRWIHPPLGAATLNDVTFPETGHGYAVGDGGTVLRTNDGGGTWEARPTPSGTGDLLAVSAYGQLVVACGKNGTLIRSTDGGSTFSPVLSPLDPTPPDFVGLQAIDAQDGVLVAADGSFFTTSDGFQTLEPAGTLTALTPTALWFANPKMGWVVGSANSGSPLAQGAIVETTDGGTSFNVVHTAFGGEYRAVTGVGQTVVAAGSISARVSMLRPSDGPPASWTDNDLPIGPVNAVSLALGNPNDAPELWFAADDGLWDMRAGDQKVEQQLAQTDPRVLSVATATRGLAFAVGQGGSIYKALYGQGHATIVNGGDTESYTSASFPTADGQFGCLASEAGSSYVGDVTTDGLNTITPLQSSPMPILEVDWLDAKNGFGLLQGGWLWATHDGGANWNMPITLSNNPTAIAFSSTTTGYAAGNGILETTDGGGNWQTVVPPQSVPFASVATGPEDQAAAVADSAIWTSGPWTLRFSAFGLRFGSVAFLADGTIVAGGISSNGAGGGIEFLRPDGTRFTALTSHPVRSLAAVGTRLFALFADNHVSEILPDGSESSVFDAGVSLNGLAARTVMDASGLTHPAPVAYGDYGALLGFDDGFVSPPAFQVTSVTASAQPQRYSGPCPTTVRFTGTITATGSGTVTYAWQRSDGATSGKETLTFAASGTQTVTESWSLGGPSLPSFSGWEQLVVLAPQSLTSNQATFTVSCLGNSPVVTVTPPSMILPPGQVGKLLATATDPQGLPLTYAWSDPNGAGLAFGSPTAAATTVSWAAAPPSGTKAAARVTVCDSAGACATADAIIDSGPGTTGNQTPVAVAKGTAVETGQPIFLDGTASFDPDGDTLTYAWKQLSGTPAAVQGTSTGPVFIATAPDKPGNLVFQLTVCDPDNFCGSIELTVVVSLPGQSSPPVAMTKGDLVVPPFTNVTLDASDSYDPDGTIASFAWREVSGPPVQITTPTDAVASFTAGSAGTSYRFAVRVCDLQNACSEAAMNVVVSTGPPPINPPPTVEVVHPLQNANVGDQVALSAIASDPDGEQVRVSWTDNQPQLGLNLQPSGPADATFTVPPAAANMKLSFTVTACDPEACATASATVVVAPLAAVVANAGPDQSVSPGALVTLDGSASTGPIAGYAWKQTGGATVQLANAHQARTTFTAPITAGDLEFTLTVTGNDGQTASDSVKVTVSGPVEPIADAGPEQTVGWGARVQLDGSGSHDPASRPLTFSWKAPAGITLAGADAAIATFYAPANDAQLGFTLTVCAGQDCADASTTVNVVSHGNLPPIADAGPDQQAMGGTNIILDGTGSLDPEGGALMATWSAAAGSGATIERPSSLWTPAHLPFVTAEEKLTFTLRVCDPEGACSTDSTLVDVFPAGPTAPTIAASIEGHPDNVVDDDADFTVALKVACPAAPCADGGEVRVVSGPAISRVGSSGFTFHAPLVDLSAAFTLEASVCDTANHCAATTLNGLVKNTVNVPPVVVVGADQSAARRQTVVLDGSGSYDPDGDLLTFSWTQKSGATMSLVAPDSPRARFVVPADATPGVLAFELTVCDDRSACATADTRVTITSGAPANRPPVADAGGDRTGPARVPFVLDGSRSYDPDGDPLSYAWSIVSGAGAKLESTGQATTKLDVSGPTAKNAPIVVQLQACDSLGACATDTATVTAYAEPTDGSTGAAQLGAASRGCGCAGDPTSLFGLLAGALAFAFKRRRR